jgi:hypothetical protein
MFRFQSAMDLNKMLEELYCGFYGIMFQFLSTISKHQQLLKSVNQ